MVKYLLISVGTGIGSRKDLITDSLAHGISFSINSHNPDHVVFFVTSDSRVSTLGKVLKQVDLSSHEFVLLDDFVDFEHVYNVAKDKILALLSNGIRQSDIVIDYTSGTKAMSAGLAIAAVSCRVGSLSYINGKRQNGVVVHGSEKILSLKPTTVFIDGDLQLVTQLFYRYQFTACLDILAGLKQQTGDREILSRLSDVEFLCKAYKYWDSFDHVKACEFFKEIKVKLDIPAISLNKKFLHQLVKAGSNRNLFLMADLLNNARRRHEEGKHDDCTARLYRVVELSAQTELARSGIDTSDIDLSLVPKEHRDAHEKLRDDKGKIKIGLHRAHQLLAVLGNKLGVDYLNDARLRDLLKKRNDSILAHGLKPVSAADSQDLLNIVTARMTAFYTDMTVLIRESTFPAGIDGFFRLSS
ncbi:MAG: TIGR02710 family CRISPR-associated CARF protein [Candidatus Hodarchaeales archaeon]